MMAEGGGDEHYSSISQSSENLDIDLEELDDTEYDIPPVDNPPTLESILNEPDDVSVSDEELSNQFGLFHEPSDTVSVTSTSSLDSKGRKLDKKQRSPLSQFSHGSILRHVILRGVSSQLVSAAERVNAGLPTAMAVGSLIAVGTSHGLVLVFDGKQVLKWCLGSVGMGAQYGSVSALAFNRDCTRLLCGFAKGQITMWDITNGKLLRTITDAHPPGSAILHIKFTDDTTLAVCSDSGGSVFELNFRRMMGVRSCESRCLFSGSRGEVCTIEPLQIIDMKDHPLQEVCLLAMATMSKVIIVSIRPSLKVLFTHALHAKPSTLPLIAWQFVIIQVSPQIRMIDPVFSFGRENVVYFFQVSVQSRDKIHFIPLKKMEFQFTMLNFTWLNPRTLVVLDTMEHLHVIDVRTQEDLEVIDLADVQLVYGSSHFKGLSTGGNVSKAMACAAEYACYQSVMNFGGQVLLLGTKSVHLMSLRVWKERIEYFTKQNKYPEALALAYSFFEDRAKAVVGLVGKKELKMMIVAKEIWKLIDFYIEHVMIKCFDISEDYWKEVVSLCIDYDLLLDNSFKLLKEKGSELPSTLPNFLDQLFGKAYEAFRIDPVAKSIFLEALEIHILSGRMADVLIPPAIVHDFVDHYASKEMFQSLEACIVHLDVASLDLHQVLTLCWTHGLYDAILHIHNKAMHDYTGPLEELMNMLQDALKTGKQLSDGQINLGNKIMVYISCCLAGRAYPIGNIPPDQVTIVKQQIFQCLINKSPQNAKTEYPYLRALLHFDTREFLNVLALAFEEPEFNTNDTVWKRQDVVDILLEIMHQSSEFSPTQVGSLFTFLARQMAKHETTIVVDRNLFEQVLEYLTNTSEESRHEERQQALVELYAAGGLCHYDEERLLQQAEKAQFYRICELLYEKRREFNKIVTCYLQDPARKAQVFSYVKQLILGTSVSITAEEHKYLQEEILKNIEELIDIDNMETARLVLLCFPKFVLDIMHQLEKNLQSQYRFLQGIFETNSSIVTGKDEIILDPAISEKYIELMCQFAPSQVYTYIKIKEDYRLEETLEIVKRYEVMDVVAFLLEKLGDIQGAFAIMLQNLEKNITEVENHEETETESLFNHKWNNLQATLLVLIQFCQRSSRKMDEGEREALWFPLLDAIMVPQKKLKGEQSDKYLKAYKELTRHLLNSMMGYIKLPSILQKIITDPSYNVSKFSEVRDLLLGMLDTYNYEKTLLQTTNNLLNSDLHGQLVQLQFAANRGFVSRSNACSYCNHSYNQVNESDCIVVFRCGHSYHLPCIQLATGTEVKGGNTEQIACSICYTNYKRKKLGSHRISFRNLDPNISKDKSSSRRPTEDTVTASPSKTGKVMLDPLQIQALENLRRIQKSTSRLAILSELTKKEGSQYRARHHYYHQHHLHPSLLQREDFALRLAPPKIDT